MNAAHVDAYLRRLGAGHPAAPTAAALRELQLRHLRTVPFENLSVHLDEDIVLEEERLLDKVVGAHRGGFCYELNGAFGALLAALGFEVTLLAARVFGEEGRLGIPYDHLALRVRTADGGDWLTDVGFGALSHFPLAFEERGEQVEPGGTLQIVAAAPGPEPHTGPAPDPHLTGTKRSAGAAGTAEHAKQAGTAEHAKPAGTAKPAEPAEPAEPAGTGDLDVVLDGKPQYRLELRPRVLGDFVAGAWWHSTSPASHFTRSLVCSRLTEDGGRVTLGGRTLTTTGLDGTREVRDMTSDEEVLAVYRDRFGIELASVPAVRNRNPGRSS
ncbi:arylamine N-acetyltransferase [Streptomyces sp. NPDC020801]|uniref:arylamine N-acetyltransferase n=1 Tax=Streptomyces sp. NPDC020801 TaxID=3365093 RepID=UPI0037B4F31A